MNPRSRVAILTGAGLNKSAGFPTSVELANMLRNSLIEASDRLGNTESDRRTRQIATSHLATYRFLNGGIRFQQGILNSDPDKAVNIEQLAVAAEELQFRAENPLSPYSSGWHPRILELERDAKENATDLLGSFVEFIYTQLDQWLRLREEHVDRISYLRHLFEICGDSPDFGVDIFSLNYDLCIEYALSRFVKRDFVNGFTENEGWNPETLQCDSSIRLFKLHGSLDWVEDDAYGLCSLQFPRHSYAETIEGDTIRPLLVFGTAHKLSPREPFLSLAYTFSQTVLKTTLLAIIGYSFGDDYVNQIIRQGIERNSKLCVLVVGPSADKSINSIPFLEGRQPRVVPLEEDAKTALSEGRFLRGVRELLERTSEEEPFGEN